MELREGKSANLNRDQALLLENLRRSQNDAFEELARRALDKPNVDVDFVYPHPVNKTLLEVACCEGRSDFVETLLKLGASVNRINEEHNRGPIHFAAEQGHAEVIGVILKDGRANADLEAGQQTALHLAVRHQHPECVRVLLENGANPNIANAKGLTPLHLAATNDQRETVRLIFACSKLPPNIDDFRDFRKRTTRQILQLKMPDLELPEPVVESKMDAEEIRRACLDGNDEVQLLEKLRRSENTGGIDDGELLKIAAKRNFSRIAGEVIRRNEDGTLKISEAGGIAVELGHYRVLEEILKVDPKLANDLLIPTCRELGIPSSSRRGHEDDRIKCLRVLMEQPDINVRCVDDKGNTPLHYAARAESSEAVGLLLRSGSYIGHKNVLGVPPLAHLSPGALSDFFDECLHGDNERTDEFEIEFDYRCLRPHGADFSFSQNENLPEEEIRMSRSVKNSPPTFDEMEALAFIASNRALKPLIKHPLLSSFLYLKWHRIRHILYANFIFYVIFYVLMNAYILSSNYVDSDTNSTEDSSGGASTTVLTDLRHLHGLRSFATIALILLAIRESVQLISSPWHYVKSFENLLELALIVLGAWALLSVNPQVGAVVILLSAWELVILIGQHPRMSTGIEMFKTVSINFVRFLFLYAFLILAFALAFFTLFKNSKDDQNFPDPGHSLFKTIIMLTGEFDANDIPFVAHPVLSHCIFVLFVFLIAIVLFNLLNGLAVSDTADILNKSELVGLLSRAQLISYAESVAVGSGLMRLTGQCCSERSVRRSRLNPLGILARRILLFPGYLPDGKLRVKPYKGNKIQIYGRPKKTRSCTDWSMDPWIVTRAREILSRRGEITENERMIVELNGITQRLERMEAAMEGLRRAMENNNS